MGHEPSDRGSGRLSNVPTHTSVPTQTSVSTQTFRFVVFASASPAFQCSSFINAEDSIYDFIPVTSLQLKKKKVLLVHEWGPQPGRASAGREQIEHGALPGVHLGVRPSGARVGPSISRFLPIFTDFSDFLGRLHPRQTRLQKPPNALGVAESSSPRRVLHF